MKKIKNILLTLAVFAAGTSAVFADSVDDVMKKMTSHDIPLTSACTIKMEFLDKNGTVTETRMIRQYGMKDKKNLVKTIFYFDSPASVKGTRVLQVANEGKDDDKWAYEPSLRTVRQIAAASRRSSFVGSDFTYNDMTIRKFDDDTNTMLEESANVTIKGKTYNCWKIESKPKKKDVEFTYRHVWVDKVSYLPMRIEFYDRKGIIKEWETTGYRTVTGYDGKNSYILRNGTKVVNSRSGHATEITVTKYEFDNPKVVKPEYFTTQWLNTGKF